MNWKTDEILPEYLDDLRELGKSGATFTYFMHLPKTGGSTITDAVKTRIPNSAIFLPKTSEEKSESCNCGERACTLRHKRVLLLEQLCSSSHADEHFFVFGDHRSYASVERIVEALGANQGKRSLLTTARPARQRLISAFRDYWTQVEGARLALLEPIDLPKAQNRIQNNNRHSAAKQKRYLEDSAHYRDSEGNINGVAWFTAFGIHGAGIPFFVDEVFDGDFRTFRRLVKREQLRVVATNKVDELTLELTGAVQSRRRISMPQTPAITQALADADELISELALRDAKYDTFLAKWLGDPDFRPVKR